MSLIKKIFGTKNERELKKLRPKVEAINALEPRMQDKSDAELKAMTAEFRQRLDNGATLDDLLIEAFAVAREACRRSLGMRPFDVQLIGGMVLHSGRIAEMRTGEGKTLTATLPVYLNALEGKGVHVVTVNDYLARRDCEWMSKMYHWMGLSTGVVVHGIDDLERQRAYRADVTYGQNNEFGFDYLRDNMKMSPDRMVQRALNFAIVDEVDSILIDEARTPLIISGPAEQSADLYREINRIIPRLKKDVDYTVDEKAHSAMLTDQGVERVQKLLGLDNLYDPKNLAYVHHVGQALRAHTLYKRDVNYLVEDGKVIIIDEFTGRKMPGRRWSDGLHQAIEAKEGVTIEEENQTLATITFQNYFRMYKKLSGMTGTADTEATEFHEIYKLDVVVVPTNKPMIRDDRPDLVYKNERGKIKAVIEEIVDCQRRGQPVLVGTTSVEKSEVISKFLRQRGIPHEVLNAKNHFREAEIVAQAGRKGAVTISTNMAGRGTDILLGGNPEVMAKAALREEGREGDEARYQELYAKFKAQCDAEREEVLAAGGLHILGTERHESRRIDNQLRGRAGRQGDPGSSRFYLSLEDDLLRIFGADRMTGLMERLGMEEDTPIEHKWVTKAIENAQKKVEGQHFDTRKNLLEYDDVMNQQRKTIYTLRTQILTGRYQPALSEEDIKAGKQPEIPTTSGDWTVDSLKQEVRPLIEDWVARLLDEPRIDANGNEVRADWRTLRHEIWRQTGSLADESIEKLFGGPRDALIDALADDVARSWIQQRERLYDLCDERIAEILDEHCPANAPADDWDFDALEQALRHQFAFPIEVDRSVHDLQDLADSLWQQVERRLAEREQELSRPFLLYFQRHFLLEEIDNQWIDHLKAMEHLRDGIGLRGYGQKDPKKEYKKEGFELFGEMMRNIQRNACAKLFRVQIRREEQDVPEMEQRERRMRAVHPSADGSGDAGGAYGDAADGGARRPQQTVRRTSPKIGRNDPCPCGSGKKYKKCHGRADPPAATA
ncbi:MAG: preprotein translocase subunit SecA [Deltaproteobacteria bacterium]|nr:MAG: preprotein translocase subunit SecA [Deltaproteobacteria bacterium]